ncbi:MAG: translational GTPase TypA, partial [Treponemataceae bacterium]
VNTSPLAGREGHNAQSTKLVERLRKEALMNVSLQVEEGTTGAGCVVRGRGEFQLVILIETLRREGFELSVGRPQVIYKHEGGKRLEPIEHIFVDCAEEFAGVVTEKLSARKGRMTNYVSHGSGRIRLEFSAPSRALIGYRDVFLTDTKGTGMLNSILLGYEEYRGDFINRFTGSLVADRMGEGVAYGLFNLEPRGNLFIVPGELFYEGMIIGEHNKDMDLDVNPGKTKKLSNMRSVNKDEAVTLTPIQPMTLERAIQFIRDDEEVEVTPKSIRIRKSMLAFIDRKTTKRDA